MNNQIRPHIEPRSGYRADRTRQPSQSARSLANLRWHEAILLADGAFLLIAGFAALIADLAGYFLGAGPFAALAGQPLAIGAVEAHGLAVLVGLLLLWATADDHWRWHA